MESTGQNTFASEASYRDRHHAGLVLARELSRYVERSPLVIAIPLGGVPVGVAVAQALGAELDILVVHQLGVPGHPEISAGALASRGAANINHRAMGSFGISPIALEHALDRERLVLEQHERELRGGRPPKSVNGRTVIVVDDGAAHGATLHTAINALRARGAREVVVAVPVASQNAFGALRQEADELVCPSVAAASFQIGQFYESFAPVSGAFAKQLLHADEARAAQPAGSAAASSRADVPIPAGDVRLAGTLTIPRAARGIVVFLHGRGSNRFSPRNAFVARALERAGFATLLLDLLTSEEQAFDPETGELGSDISLLGRRAVAVVDWLEDEPQIGMLPLGLFGASTGAAVALIAASERPARVAAVVSRGGRPDLAAAALPGVTARTLFIVGGDDRGVLELNEAAALQLHAPHRLEVIAGATHLFEEPGALEKVGALAVEFFGELMRVDG